MYNKADTDSCDAEHTRVLKASGDRTFLAYVNHAKELESEHFIHSAVKNAERDSHIESLTQKESVATAQDTTPSDSTETAEDMEARLRAEVLAEVAQEQAAKTETEEEMKARLKREIMEAQQP